ncbi:MAG: GH15 family glucan-1,4-alpha-glucosidase [Planctomycetota bacterium]|jgi:GH15 family glucan-1,4-alpha-glucosidase
MPLPQVRIVHCDGLFWESGRKMRDVVLGNGKLTICCDPQGWIREVFYPQPGLWNHTLGAPCKVGIRTKGVTTWLGSDHNPQWNQVNSRATQVSWSCRQSGLEVSCLNVVDKKAPLLRRQFKMAGEPGAKATLLLHHDFRLLETEFQDGVRFDQEQQRIHHYKRQANVVVGFQGAKELGDITWTLGRRDSSGGQGITALADRDYLDNNLCAVGAGESIIAVDFEFDPKGRATIASYMGAWQNVEDRSQVEDATKVHVDFGAYSPKTWESLSDHVQYAENLINVFQESVIASPDTETLAVAREHYCYLWPRDGAFIAMTWDRLGNRGAARKFYEFCSRALTDEGFLHQRYNPDGTVGSSWHPDPVPGSRIRPIQEDSTALCCLAAARHILADPQDPASIVLAEKLVFPAASFLLSYRDEASGLPLPSHDLWEERFGVHTFTVASVIAALREASAVALTFNHPLADRFDQAATLMQTAMESRLFHDDAGRYARMGTPQDNGELHLDVTPDASLSGLFLFNEKAAQDEKVRLTMESIEKELWVKNGIGGVARYRDDHYHRRSLDPDQIPGNPWIICTLWLAHWHALENSPKSQEKAKSLTNWVIKHSRSSGALPEQVHPLTGENVSVCPLLWSHSTLIDTYAAMEKEA